LGEVALKIGLKKGVNSDRTLHWTRFCFTTASGLDVHQRVRSFPKNFSKIYDRTLHQTRRC
jgi:hypothetical protein